MSGSWEHVTDKRERYTRTHALPHIDTNTHTRTQKTRERERDRKIGREREREGRVDQKGTTRSHNNTRHGQHATGTQDRC